MSPSKTLSDEISNDLKKQNVIETVNIQPMPGDELKLSDNSWDDKDDVLMWLMRMAFAKNDTEFKEYLDLAEKNEIVKVMRVTAPKDYNSEWELFSRPVL